MTQQSISPEQFIRIWQTCSTLKEVTTRTGLATTACTSRATVHRRWGIPLKKYRERRPKLDIPRLRTLCRSLAS